MKDQKSKVAQIETEIGKAAFESVNKKIDQEVKLKAPTMTTASAWIDHYLLIDFGFTPNQPYQPNSVQFYSTSEFLCSKLTDNVSIQTLAPILACKYVRVTWDVATKESVHIYGMQPKV
jgi:hypothetical protein